MSKRITYWMRLKAHPGVPMMLMLTPAFVFAGLANQNMTWTTGVVAGFLGALPFWAIVLWAARTQPIPQDEENHHD